MCSSERRIRSAYPSYKGEMEKYFSIFPLVDVERRGEGEEERRLPVFSSSIMRVTLEPGRGELSHLRVFYAFERMQQADAPGEEEGSPPRG